MKKSVLILDDSLIFRTIMKEYAYRLGFETTLAASAKEAYEILENDASYDLLLMDIEMPDETGLEVLNRIRRSLRIDIPAIAVTGHEDPKFLKKLFANGFADYLHKPAKEKDFARVVHKHAGYGNPEGIASINRVDNQDNLDLLMEFASGNNKLFLHALKSILDSAEITPAYMKELLEKNAWEELRQCAHKLCAKVAYLGKPALEDKIRGIETLAESRQYPGEIQMLIADFEQQIKQLAPALRAKYLE